MVVVDVVVAGGSRQGGCGGDKCRVKYRRGARGNCGSGNTAAGGVRLGDPHPMTHGW